MDVSRKAALRILGALFSFTPQAEVGPFFTDDSAHGYNRSDIRANLDGSDLQPGEPLTLTILVRDRRHAPLPGAQVDIWHCNAAGVYSNEASQRTAGRSWLRGYQRTNAAGSVMFTTIVPGWYEGRTTHIHLRIRSPYSETAAPDDGTNTTQLFFAQTFIDTLSAGVAPYHTQGVNPTTNAGDHVYAPQTRGATLLTLTGSAVAGFRASFTADLPITPG